MLFDSGQGWTIVFCFFFLLHIEKGTSTYALNPVSHIKTTKLNVFHLYFILSEKHPHNMLLPPPCFKVDVVVVLCLLIRWLMRTFCNSGCYLGVSNQKGDEYKYHDIIFFFLFSLYLATFFR